MCHLVEVLLRLAIIMAPQRICFVCLERQTGNPAGPNDSGPGAPKGNGSVNDAKKAKCKLFRLEPEPEPAQLRRWLAEMKERVANAFAYDPGYAFAWELKSQMALDTRSCRGMQVRHARKRVQLCVSQVHQVDRTEEQGSDRNRANAHDNQASREY